MIKHLFEQENGYDFYMNVDVYGNRLEYIVSNGTEHFEYNNFMDAEEKYKKLKSIKTNHTYSFKTSNTWKPQTDACWVEYPFAFNIDVGRRCKCMNPETDYKCPFVEDGMIDSYE